MYFLLLFTFLQRSQRSFITMEFKDTIRQGAHLCKSNTTFTNVSTSNTTLHFFSFNLYIPLKNNNYLFIKMLRNFMVAMPTSIIIFQ